MNKRFSTLLASVLLAGSCFSAFALDQKGFDAKKFYQLKAYTGTSTQYAVVDASENLLAMIPTADGTRDSLAVINPASYEEFNLTLWKPSFEKKTNAVGQVYYEITLENKDGQKLIISKENVQAGQSFYKAQPAYIGSTGISSLAKDKSTLEIDAEGVITFHSLVEASTLVYDATAEKTYEYALVAKGKALKIMMAETEVTPNEGKIISLDLVEPVTSYTLLTKDLNAEENDSFELVFSNDVKANVFANPFTANKLRAVKFEKMFTSATNTSSFKADLAAAKEATDKAFEELGDAMGAVEAEVNTAINYAKNTGIAAGQKLGEDVPNAKDIESAINELHTAKTSYFAKKSDGSTVRDSLDAAFTALKELADTTFQAAGKLPANSVRLKAYTTAVANTKSLFDKVKKETNRTYAVVDSTMNAVFFSKAYLTAEDKYPTVKETSVANKLYKDNLKTGGTLVFNQFTTGTAVDIQNLLTAVYNAADKDDFVVSDNLLTGEVADYYAIAIVDSFIDGKQAYLAVDTNYVAEKEQYFTFKADTLHSVTDENDEVVAKLGDCINLFAYKLTVDPSNIAGDEVTIKTFMPTATVAGEWYNEGIEPVEAVVVIRSLANNTHREVSVAAADDASTENTTITFKQIEAPKAVLEEGDVYYVKSMKKANAAKPYVVMTSTSNGERVQSTSTYASVPATQWMVSEANKATAKYTLVNRDFTTGNGIKYIDGTKPMYVLNADENTYVVGTDTIQLTKVESAGEAYKNLTEAAIEHQTYVLTASTFANPNAKFYMTMRSDSVVVLTDDAEQSLKFGFGAVEATKLADENMNTSLYKEAEVYFGGDTLTMTEDFVLTKKTATAATFIFRRVNDKADQYEILLGAAAARQASPKVGVDQDGFVVKVGATEITNWAFNLTATTIDSYAKVEAPKNMTISLKDDAESMVAAAKPFATIKRVGLELKAAATENDFVLGLDTAYVERDNNFRYAYYITKAIDTEKVGSFDKKAYMVTYADSVRNAVDKKLYSQDNLTRIGFVAANRIDNLSGDSIAIHKLKPVKGVDTIHVAGANYGVTNATWAFIYNKTKEGELDGSYTIEGGKNSDKGYVSYLNGILVMGNREQAQAFVINDTELAPTDNEAVSTSSIKVVAGEGNVTIAGAAGKKVVISNVLGQVIANTVLTSDDATLSAPAGVVVVAVEGEEAVKAIVK